MSTSIPNTNYSESNPNPGSNGAQPVRTYVSNREPTYNPFAQNNPVPQNDISNLGFSTIGNNYQQAPAVNPTFTNPAFNNLAATNNPVVATPKKGNGCNPFAWLWSLIKGLFSLLDTLKNVLTAIFTLIMLLGLALVFVVLSKPPLLWNPLKTFLNNGVVAPTYVLPTQNDVYAKINSQAEKNIPVVLENPDLTRLFADYTLMGDKCFVTAVDNGLSFQINIDSVERPLWFVVLIKLDENNRFVVDRAGFGLFETPSFFNKLLTDTLGQFFAFIEKQVTASSKIIAFSEILQQEKIADKLDLLDIKFLGDKVVLYYSHNSNSNSNFNY